MGRKFKSVPHRLVITAPLREPSEPEPRDLSITFKKRSPATYKVDGRALAMQLSTRLPSATLQELCLCLDDYLSLETRAGVTFSELLGRRPSSATWADIDDADQGGKRVKWSAKKKAVQKKETADQLQFDL